MLTSNMHIYILFLRLITHFYGAFAFSDVRVFLSNLVWRLTIGLFWPLMKETLTEMVEF